MAQHGVKVNGAKLHNVLLRDVPIGAYFVVTERINSAAEKSEVFARLWHDEDEEAYRFMKLSNPRQTWQGDKDSTVLSWRVRVLQPGECITINVNG